MSEPMLPDYVLGTDPVERERLGTQHGIWADQMHSTFRRAGFQPGQTLLDIGSGPGFTTFDLAELVGPTGTVIGIESARTYFDDLCIQASQRGLSNVRPLHADAQALALPEGSADGAYARWVLCFVPRPADVVAGVARVLRAGGVFAVQDYFKWGDMALFPRFDAFAPVKAAALASFVDPGGDPAIAQRLPAMMRSAGLDVSVFEPITRIGRPGSRYWSWAHTFWIQYSAKLVAGGRITEDLRTEFLAGWDRNLKDPDAYCYTPPQAEIIAIKRP